MNRQEQKSDMIKSPIVDDKQADVPKPPINFLLSLWKGLEAVNSYPLMLVIPVLLDCFLWFGPHFSMAPWFATHQSIFPAGTFTDAANNGADVLKQFFQEFNLASLLSTGWFFPPSLMAYSTLNTNPVGVPLTYPLISTLQILEFCFAFTLLSLPLGSLYWALAGLAVEREARTWRGLLGGWGRVLALLIIFAIAYILMLVFIGLPILFLVTVLSVVSSAAPLVLTCGLFFASWAILWVVLFIAFSPHDAVLFRSNPIQAVLRSVETVRIQYPSAMIPLVLWGGLLWLTRMIWGLPPQTDWVGLVGIVGSAYTSSVLVAASLEYYRDRRRWVAESKAFFAARLAEGKSAVTTIRG
jgi:hypothetical protein